VRGGIVFRNDNDSKDAFDLVGMGGKPLDSPLTIDTAIHEAVNICRELSARPAIESPFG
jgi:hypothetical protein